MKKSLGTGHVFSIATGAMISSGFFLLPGIAFSISGPAVVIAYLLAALLIIPTMLSTTELATAMPRSGGTYFFVSRTMGPIAGIIDGLGAWLAMVAKSTFALVGIGFYVALVLGRGEAETVSMTAIIIAVCIALLLGGVNAFGTRHAGRFQALLVIGLVGISVWFIGHGSFHIQSFRLEPFAPFGIKGILAVSALVFVSYAGLTKVASVSEEIINPEKTIPRGLFLALGVTALIYVLGVLVVVGVVPADKLKISRTPIADAALVFGGRAGLMLMVTAGILAFVTTANAGIMSASHYLLAMGRDRVLPGPFGRLNRREIPVAGLVLSVSAVVLLAVLLNVLKVAGLAKLASTFLLVEFAAVNLSVIVIRESHVRSYDPGFRCPGYPWVQLAGVMVSGILIPMMGWKALAFALVLLGVGLAWYLIWARDRVEHAVAVDLVLQRIAEQILSRDTAGLVLDRELRQIMKEKGLRSDDPFLEVLRRAVVMDLPGATAWDDLIEKAADVFARRHPEHAQAIREGLLEAGRLGQTPSAGGVALPHLCLEGFDGYELVAARSRNGLLFPGIQEPVKAVFILLGSRDDPQQHLRILAGIATRAGGPHFLELWESCQNQHDLLKLLLPEQAKEKD